MPKFNKVVIQKEGSPNSVVITSTQNGQLNVNGAPLSNFGSGNAADGTVLTADGAGGAAWETPSGGGDTRYIAALSLQFSGEETLSVARVIDNTFGEVPTVSWADLGAGQTGIKVAFATATLPQTTTFLKISPIDDNPLASSLFMGARNLSSFPLNTEAHFRIYTNAGSPITSALGTDFSVLIEIYRKG